MTSSAIVSTTDIATTYGAQMARYFPKGASREDIALAREAHKALISAYDTCACNSPALVAAIMRVATRRDLPRSYRHALAQQVEDMCRRTFKGDEMLRQLLPVLKVQAYTCDESQRRYHFNGLTTLQSMIGDKKADRASALANLAATYEGSDELHDKVYAATHFGQAYELCPDYFLANRYASALAVIGEFEKAYNLVAEYAKRYFGLRDAEGSDCNDNIMGEPRTTSGD